MMKPNAAGALFSEIRQLRDCGIVHAGVFETGELLAVARAFGLREDASIYRDIAEEEARRVLVRILHRDLAYYSELMPQKEAERLSSTFLGLIPNPRFVTNGRFHDAPILGPRVQVLATWNSAASATFDTGVILVGEKTSACLWIEDED